MSEELDRLGQMMRRFAGEGPRILAGMFPEAEISGPEGGYALVAGRAGHDARWVGEAAYHGRWLRWRP
jgi:hypothetical protein